MEWILRVWNQVKGILDQAVVVVVLLLLLVDDTVSGSPVKITLL